MAFTVRGFPSTSRLAFCPPWVVATNVVLPDFDGCRTKGKVITKLLSFISTFILLFFVFVVVFGLCTK